MWLCVLLLHTKTRIDVQLYPTEGQPKHKNSTIAVTAGGMHVPGVTRFLRSCARYSPP
jgi:hypothetical protein